MADVLCPKCATLVNSRGLAGHLRFKHKVKPGKQLAKVMEDATPHEYRRAMTWMDKLGVIRDRAQELKWLYYNKRLGLSLEEFRKLLETMRLEYERVLHEENIWTSSSKGSNKPATVEDMQPTLFTYDLEQYKKWVEEYSSAITDDDKKPDLLGTTAGWKKQWQTWDADMRRRHG
jgi:hypothetical protein